jgi:hypothetical protein
MPGWAFATMMVGQLKGEERQYSTNYDELLDMQME